MNSQTLLTYGGFITFAAIVVAAFHWFMPSDDAVPQSTVVASLPVVAAPRKSLQPHAPKKHHTAHTLDEAMRQQIFLLRSQTLYLAAAQFPGDSTDPQPQDEYQDHLLAAIDRRYKITEAQASAIDREGATKMWPQMGLHGQIMHIH